MEMGKKNRKKKNKGVVEVDAVTSTLGDRRKNSQRIYQESSNGELSRKKGKDGKHKQQHDAKLSAPEADVQSTKNKSKERVKRKLLEKQQEQQDNAKKKKRESKKQKQQLQDECEGESKGKEKRWAREGDVEGFGVSHLKQRNLIVDERFAAAHSDPRFQRLPQRESKVAIDSRFSGMFSDNRFFTSSALVDKRGRPKEKTQNPLLHYYLQEEEKVPVVEEEDREDNDRMPMPDEETDPSSSDDEDPKRIEADTDTGSSTDEESEEEDDNQFAENNDTYQFWMKNQEDTPTIENETRRLAVVNMDWDHIKAVDLYVMMSTCLSTSCPQNGGQILSVVIYPSDFGLKCMEIEAVRGPHALFNGENNVDDSEDSETDDETVNDKIRSYQLNRLKYYYAVVECDSSATANHLYNALDGIEFLKTANVLDLRFIPDSMEFKHPPREIAREAPPDYKQPDFETCALQHSNVKLTWDDDEPDRKKYLRRKFDAEKMDELEQYLASDDSDCDSDVNEAHGDKYNALLQSADASDTDEDNDSGKEMEIKFLPGVENLSKHIDKNKLDKSDTGVWDAYLRKKREKKKRNKNHKSSSDDDSEDSEYYEPPHQADDFFVEESSETDEKDVKTDSKKGSLKAQNKISKKNRRDPDQKDEEMKEASRAELELLLADDDGTNEHLKGFNLRPKKAKGKKGKEVPMEDKLPDVDAISDPRFSSRLTSHMFALDPTDPQYKRSATGMRQARAQKQRNADAGAAEALNEGRTEHPTNNGDKSSKERQDIMSLIRSVKLKSRALGRSGQSE